MAGVGALAASFTVRRQPCSVQGTDAATRSDRPRNGEFQVRLDVIGDGPMFPVWQAEAEKLDISALVNFRRLRGNSIRSPLRCVRPMFCVFLQFESQVGRSYSKRWRRRVPY